MRGFLGGTVAVAAALAAPALASARDVTVRSFDGTNIAAHFFPTKGLHGGERAPTILLGHVYGGSSETNEEARAGPLSPGELRSEGYNVLTWDARGFGQSGGTAELDSKDYEGRDVQALIDYVAEQPEAQLDGHRDPRVGMGGESYGGAIQLVTAAIDGRVDAIVPRFTWSDLVRSLYRNKTAKTGWNAYLTGVGVTATTGGAFTPGGAETGSVDPHMTNAAAEGDVSGRISEENVRWLAERSTAPLIPRIETPTLVMQGTIDTLFTLRESMDMVDLLKGRGVPFKLMWLCLGHGACLGNSREQAAREREVILDWYARYLKGNTSVDTGPMFEWLTDTDGRWHSAEMFPPVESGRLRASGSGNLPLHPGTTSGQVFAASPSEVAVNVEIPAPARPVDVLGEPRLKLTYAGGALLSDTRVYAQLVDVDANQAIGNQVTPIPVFLDGPAHTAEFALEPVAARFGPGSHWRLQIVPGSNVYDVQRSGGMLEVRSAEIELPTIDADARPRLDIGGVYGLRRGRRRRPIRPVRVDVRALTERYVGAKLKLLRLRRGEARLIAESPRFALGTGFERVSIPVRRRLRRGSYQLVLAATDLYGRRAQEERALRLR